MIVLGLLQTFASQLMHHALARNAQVILSTSAAHFASLMRRDVVDVAVVDPGACGTDECVGPHPAVIALASAPHVPFLLYMSGATRSFDLTRSLFDLKPAGLLMRGIDDTPGAIVAAVRQGAAASLQGRIAQSIAPELDRVPERMRMVLRRIFVEPDVSENVSDLCEAADVPRRSFDRRLADAGLSSAWTFLAAGRYSSGRRLQNDVKAVLDMTPTAMRQLDVSEFVERLRPALTGGCQEGADPGEVEFAVGKLLLSRAD
jgi:hypothetical protein